VDAVVAEVGSDGARLVRGVVRTAAVALQAGDVAECAEGDRTVDGRLGTGRDGSLEPLPAFVEEQGDPQEPGLADELQRALTTGVVPEAVIVSRPDVGLIQLERRSQRLLCGTVPLQARLTEQLLDPGDVAVDEVVVLSLLAEARLAVLAERLEHPEADLALALGTGEDRLLEQPLDDVEHGMPRQRPAGAHLLGGLHAETPGEDRRPSPERAFVVGAQLVGPVDGRLDGAVS
jgi:hypothetical protein